MPSLDTEELITCGLGLVALLYFVNPWGLLFIFIAAAVFSYFLLTKTFREERKFEADGQKIKLLDSIKQIEEERNE